MINMYLRRAHSRNEMGCPLSGVVFSVWAIVDAYTSAELINARGVVQ